MKITSKSIIWSAAVLGIAAVGVFILNSDELELASRQVKNITPDTFAGTKDINYGDIVQLTGTPDLLNAVGLEDRTTGNIYEYYVPLQEYDSNFIIQIKKSKLRTELQTFTGVVTGLTREEYSTRIRNVLNKPVELTDDDRAELDSDTIQILSEQTTRDFTSKTLMVIDDQIPDVNSVYANIVFWSLLLGVAGVTFFRHQIFS